MTPVVGPAALGKEDFLRLLVTQLRHQDPLQPLDAQDFAAQLAQFTALEQQIRTNDLLEADTRLRAAAMLEDQKATAVDLIGRSVVAPGDRVELRGSSDDAVFVSTSGAATFSVQLTDAAGRVVFSREASAYAAGIHRVSLSERGIPPGSYTLSVTPTSRSATAAVMPLASGIVQGVRLGPSGPVLVVSDREVPLVDVVQINS
jgi:flagellar basal-body rod modification protein FlgD